MKSSTTILATVIAILFYTNVFAQNKSYALAWDPVPQKYDNILPVFQFQSWHLEQNQQLLMKNWLDSMPAGQKAFRVWLFDRFILVDNPKNVIYDANGDTVFYHYTADDIIPPITYVAGDSIPLIGPWWDEGMDELAIKLDTFFSIYKAIGGELDFFILDLERPISNWSLDNIANNQYEGNRLFYYNAIANDPRFNIDFNSFTTTGCDFVNNVMNFTTTDSCYLIFNDVGLDRYAYYLNNAIYEPIKNHFPNVKGSEWQVKHHDKDYPVPDFNGHKGYRYGNGAHAGTHQNEATYGCIGQISDYIGNSVVPGVPYPRTKFNILKYDLNLIKAMRLSSSIPISTWIAYQDFECSSLSTYKNSNYYQEMIFHTLLSFSDEDFLMYWQNPAYLEENDSILDLSLKHFDKVISYTNLRIPVTDSLIWWFDDFALSTLETDSFYFYRFTPYIDDTINFNAQFSLVSNLPATFNVNGRIIIIPDAEIIVPDTIISDYGFWIRKKKNTTTIEEKEIISVLSVYPNPAINELNFTFTNNSVQTLAIHDITGKAIVMMATEGKNRLILNTEQYAHGIYVYTITDKNFGTYRGKFIVVK